MKKYLTEELKKFLLGLVSTASGVLIALLINSDVDEVRNKETYNSMLKAIKIEAIQNQKVLNESFILNYKLGIVRRELSVKICDEFVTDKIFLDHAPTEVITHLTNYSLN